jgi:hypothetical protein
VREYTNHGNQPLVCPDRGQNQIDTIQQVAHLLAGRAAGLHVRAFLLVQQIVGDVHAAITAMRSAPITLPLLRISRILPSR